MGLVAGFAERAKQGWCRNPGVLSKRGQQPQRPAQQRDRIRAQATVVPTHSLGYLTLSPEARTGRSYPL